MTEAEGGLSLLFEVGVVVFLVLLNAFFAMSELAIVSSRPARLKQLAGAGHRGAKTALGLQADPTQFLATVQFGITLVGIIAGAYSGATLSKPVAEAIASWPLIGCYAYPISVGLVVAAITYLSLVIGELVPKRIAMSHAEGIAVVVSRPMAFLARLGAPIVFALRTSTEFILRLLGIRQSSSSKVTEEEIKMMISEGTDAGVFVQEERRMIEGVLHLADHPIRTIMTPRPDIEWLDVNDPSAEQIKSVIESDHSRLLLCEGVVDEVIGFVHVKDLFSQIAASGSLDPRQCVSNALTVHESTTVLRMLDIFRNSPNNLALVLDEYGSIEGIVTPRDIFAAIAGEFVEDATDDLSITKRDDSSWSADGRMKVPDLERAIGASGLADEEYTTIAGLVLHRLGHIPKIGETLTYREYAFEVADLDGRRIDRVIVRRVS